MKSTCAIFVTTISVCVASAQTAHVASVRTNLAVLDRSRNRASVPLLLSHPPGEFHALLKEGNTLRIAPDILSHTGGSTNLEIEPNTVYFLTHKASGSLAAPGQSVTNRLLASSLVLMGRTADGPAASHTEIVSGNFFLRSLLEPVPWDSKTKA